MRRVTRRPSSARSNLVGLVVFGVAFGFVEAAVVCYLRALGNFHQNYALTPYHTFVNLGFIAFVSPVHSLILHHRISTIEVWRELATLVMLASLSYIVATTWPRRLGALCVSFASWDLAYYGFLRVLDHWPRTLFTRDVFFLIPVAWVGPVLTPIVISLGLLVLGSWLFLRDPT